MARKGGTAEGKQSDKIEWSHSERRILKEVITMETEAESPIQLENKMNFDILRQSFVFINARQQPQAIPYTASN